MFLKKATGGTSIGGHEWAADGDVTEVPDALAAELLALDPEEFSEVDEPKRASRKTPTGKTIISE